MCRPMRYAQLLLLTSTLCLTGCGGTSAPSKPANETGSASESADSESATAETNAETDDDAPPAFKLGDLIKPFDAPTLEEVDATANWIDQPTRDGMQVMRKLLAEEGKPEITIEEALAMKNNSVEDNLKMRAALGQMPPEDGSGVDYEASIVRHTTADLKSTNPLQGSSVTEFEYADLTGMALISFDKHFNFFAVADVVKSWQTSEDRLVDKFVLRDDLTWSDGTPITAHDFEYTFKVIMTKAVIVPAIRQGTDELRMVKAYDDHTLVIFHQDALATNLGNMLYPVLPKHVYEKTIPDDPTMSRSKEHSRLEDKPVVPGAYELVKRTRGQEFVLRRRESYYLHNGKQVRDKPYFKEVRIKTIEDVNTALLALKAGDIEQMEFRPEQWVNQTNDNDFYEKNTKATATEWVDFHFVWNQKTPYFSDKRVRWAMSYAVDYEELIETVCYGIYQQSQGNFHPSSWMFNNDGPEPLVQNLDQAEELLEEAGWTDTDGDGIRDKEINGRRIPFEFTMLTGQTETSIQACTLMKESLNLIGVVCNVKPTEFTVLQDRMRTKKFQAGFSGWGTGADPSTNKNIFGTGEGRNYGSYSNPEVDELYDQGKREFDRDKRAEIYSKINNLMWEDQPYTWLFYRNSFYGFNKKLRGYNFSPRGPFGYSPGFGSVFVPIAQP